MTDKKSIKQTFIFQSIFTELEKLDECLNSIEGYKELSEDKQYEIMLVLSEAVNNAIEHGNEFNSNKKVKLDITLSTECIIAEIYDEGPGFNPDKLVNPLEKKAMLKDHGRGWFLMQHYSSSIEWDDKLKCLRVYLSIE
tara:strand:+ start:1307 stop:1723 length:417 start_codon:yes stop_codon:yes gene_type:complete